MNTETYIVVKNCSKDELKTMLNDWLEMYAAHLRSRMTFEIAETAPNTFALKVDEGIDDTHFFYMVNYFSFPFDFKKTFEAEGYTTATKHKMLLGKNIYVFIDRHEHEHEHTNVRITTEDGETYKFDFAGTLKKTGAENNYKAWNPDCLLIARERIDVDKKTLLAEATRREDEKSRRGTAKRFKIVSALLFVLTPAAYLINRHFSYIENVQLGLFSALAIAVWFMMDHKIFHTLQRTFVCVLLSLLNVALGITTQMDSFGITVSTLPLSAIVVMLVANKFLGARIEEIEYSRWDRLYSFALLVVSGLISYAVFYPVLKFLNIIAP